MRRKRGYAQLTDEQLLAMTAQDAEAFGCLYDRLEADVLGFLYRATGSAEVAADLTAEVFASALCSASSFDAGRGTVRGWVFGIARHELADTWRRRRVEDHARRRLGLEPLALSDEALEKIEMLGESTQVMRLLESLPEDQRRAVEGRVVQERDYHELAVSLSCSESVVRQRVSRGLKSMRAHLEESR